MAKAIDIKALDARRKMLDKYLTSCKATKTAKKNNQK
ncbi:hypothetical protein Desca_2573 [Desulfotomaculum nigrificans CO-1-SRB]|uniref:Uncharacterized protein n=1 Tax=Desulfotomaculum nigrificans (strain DSM 14880 / VKM B-2319 / CO-1-SRB) TaxID=868595 RepID=F6B5G3_DESCC|nr:hypothetical protein Desca_2573 [Desulfotomaculum nigrificans CO-1-SRB]